MTAETRTRAINDVVIATGGHDTVSLLSAGEFKDVIHKLVLQTPTAILLSERHTTRNGCDTQYKYVPSWPINYIIYDIFQQNNLLNKYNTLSNK